MYPQITDDTVFAFHSGDIDKLYKVDTSYFITFQLIIRLIFHARDKYAILKHILYTRR